MVSIMHKACMIEIASIGASPSIFTIVHMEMYVTKVYLGFMLPALHTLTHSGIMV